MQAKIYNYDELYSALNYQAIEETVRNSDQMDSLNQYVYSFDSYYQEINDYLRYYPGKYNWYGIGPRDARKYIKDINFLIKNHPTLPKDLTLFRGLDLTWRKNKPFQIGEKFSDKAFTSTSLNLKIAEEFASQERETSKNSEKALFVMYFANPLQKGILVSKDEEEVILPSGLTFKVMKAKDKQQYQMYLIQVCHNSKCNINPPDSTLTDWNSL